MSTSESCFSNCGVLITGDFNRLDTSIFRNAFKLKQIVKFHTRGNQTLDLVLTNIKEFYAEPIKRPAFGPSDHASVELQPLSHCKKQPSKRSITTRDQRESYRVALSSYFEKFNITDLVKNKDTCDEKVQIMEEAIICGMDAKHAPERKVCISERGTMDE